ncbi:MAG: Crp/Fnr family transcriptional regulator [Chloroflexi bacterium]|nr:Crp/Fnr family transcriptional regulator [Chloroflexota bacterium]
MKPPSFNLVELLGRVEHFKRLLEADRVAIVNAGQVRAFSAGATIYREGESAAGMFVLLSGHVHLLKLGPQGQQSIVAEFDPIIMFNEVTVLDGGANLTTAIAVQACVTWNIQPAAFQALLQRDPTIGLGLLRVLAARMRNLMAQYEDVSFRSVLARTAKLLLDLSARGAQPIQRQEYPNADLAARISTVPEAVSRSLQVFRKNGDITCTRATITVNQPATLEKFAQVEKGVVSL